MIPDIMNCGRSSMHLLPYESDLVLAKNYHLLPSDLDLEEWLCILQGWIPALFDSDQAYRPSLSIRRAPPSRIHWIYRLDSRFRFQRFCRGYCSSSQIFLTFLNRLGFGRLRLLHHPTQVVDIGVLADPGVSGAVTERRSFTTLSNEITCTVRANIHRTFSIFGGAHSRRSR